jgi:hypothetical protein
MYSKPMVWTGRIGTLGAIALSAACAGPTAELQVAQNTVAQARQDPNIVRNAPLTLFEAEETLRRAQGANDDDEMKHLAYLAQRQATIASYEAQRKVAETTAQFFEQSRVLE